MVEVKNKIVLTEDVLTSRIFDELHSCDGDVLAHIAGLMFGGECHAIDNHYEFFPNENYFEGFGKLVYTVTDHEVTVFKGDLDEFHNTVPCFFSIIPTHSDIVDYAKRMKYTLSFEEQEEK